MVDRKTIQSQLADIAARLEELELRVEEREDHPVAPGAKGNEPGERLNYCCIPPQPPRTFSADINPERARAILAIGNKWVNGTPLRYYFFTTGTFGGDSTQQDVVRRAFDVWKDIGIGLTFTEVASPANAEVRIGFDHTAGSWSLVGTDVLNAGVSERTMNFGWNLNVSGSNGLDTAVHEIGHTLGLQHEHQNPNAGITWNVQAVYDYFARTQSPPWTHAVTDFNILRKIDPSSVSGTTWDPDSIMHYAFVAGLIDKPAQYRTGLYPRGGLSDGDKQVIRQFYPPAGNTVASPELRVKESQFLNVAAGEQRDLLFTAPENREYTMRTFGDADTVMVLFEDAGGQLHYIGGDDDSGDDRNAELRVRLIDGRRYRLKIRLYYKTDSGTPSVMVW